MKLTKGTPGPKTKPEKVKQKSFSFTAKNWQYFKGLTKKEQKEFSILVSTFLNDELAHRRMAKYVIKH